MKVLIIRWLLFFSAVLLLVALLFWLYLNMQASMHVQAQQADVRLSDTLPTKISVGNYLQAHAKGLLNTEINVNQDLNLPIKGRYLTDLKFTVEVPVAVDIDHQVMIKVDQIMPLETTTDLIYKKKFLPRFPLKLDIPIRLDVPFHLKRTYHLPVMVEFDGPVYLELDENVQVPIRHQFKPQLQLDDAITMKKIADFDATMRNRERNTKANLEMQMVMPLKNIHP